MPSNLASLGVGRGASTLPNGLISYWKLDEASGSAFDAFGANTLTDNNTVTSAVGKVGTARQFTAANSESLSIADNASFNVITTGLTVSMWLYPDSLGSVACPICKFTYQTDGEWAVDTSVFGTGDIRVLIAANATDATNRATTAVGLLAIGVWTHVVAVFDGAGALNADRLKIYVNGVSQTLAFNGTIPATIRNGTAPLIVGDWGGTIAAGHYWNGRIDEVKLASRAWTAAEIAEDYANGLAGRPLL